LQEVSFSVFQSGISKHMISILMIIAGVLLLVCVTSQGAS